MKKFLLALLPILFLLPACTSPVTDKTRALEFRTRLDEGIAHVCPVQDGAQAPALTSIQTTIAGLTAQWEVIQATEAANGLTLPGLTAGVTEGPAFYQTKCDALKALVAEADLLAKNPETDSSRTEKIAIYNLADAAITSDADLNAIFTQVFTDAKSAVDGYNAFKSALASKKAQYQADPSQALQNKLASLETTLHDIQVALESGDWAKASMIAESGQKELATVDSLKTLPSPTPGAPTQTGIPTQQPGVPSQTTSGGAVIVPSNGNGTIAEPTVTPIVNLPNP